MRLYLHFIFSDSWLLKLNRIHKFYLIDCGNADNILLKTRIMWVCIDTHRKYIYKFRGVPWLYTDLDIRITWLICNSVFAFELFSSNSEIKWEENTHRTRQIYGYSWRSRTCQPYLVCFACKYIPLYTIAQHFDLHTTINCLIYVETSYIIWYAHINNL